MVKKDVLLKTGRKSEKPGKDSENLKKKNKKRIVTLCLIAPYRPIATTISFGF